MKYASAAIALILFAALPAFAQLDAYVSQTAISISISPEHPAPGNTVRVEAHSTLFDLAASDVIWYVSGRVVAEGAGLSSTNVTAGAAGSETSVRAIASQAGIGSASAEAVIRPVEMDLLWESDSYVPPFYRGRALPSEGASVRLQAIPRFRDASGALVAPSDIIFTWKKNDSVVQSASGLGKSSAILDGPVLFGTDVFSVDAKTTDGTFTASASAQISSTEPLLLLYEDHPLYGMMYHRAISGQTSISEVEAAFAATPYFAPLQNLGGLKYAWQVNGQSVAGSATHPNELTINATGSSGQALLTLALTHATNYFLSAAGSWNILFGGNGRGSATGGANLFNGPSQ